MKEDKSGKEAEGEPIPAPVDIKSSIPIEVTMVTPDGTPAPSMGVATTAPEVIIANPHPVAVEVVAQAPPRPQPTVLKSEGVTLSPTTTEENDLMTKGQRHINRVWEYNQAAIALLITGAVIYCAVNEITSQELSNGFFLIIGFYFSRTNHQATGGTGSKPDAGVQGR